VTARELVAKLQALIDREDAADLPVVVEGCDCYEFASDVELDGRNHVTGKPEPVVTITRIVR
jgi:hypothetical protein